MPLVDSKGTAVTLSVHVIKNRFRRLLLPAIPLVFTVHVAGQQSSALSQGMESPRTLAAADYARAEKFMPYNTDPLVYHAVHPAWTEERLWYRDASAEGAQFLLFDPITLRA